MSTEDDTDDELDPEDPDLLKKLRRLTRDQAKQLKEAEASRAEADQLKRERAFLRAGIDPDDPAARYFVKGYDGDLDTDAIREAAIEARILGSGDSEQINQALAGAERATAAASGGRPPSTDSDLAAFSNLNALKAKFKNNEELVAFLQSHGIGGEEIAAFQQAGPRLR